MHTESVTSRLKDVVGNLDAVERCVDYSIEQLGEVINDLKNWPGTFDYEFGYCHGLMRSLFYLRKGGQRVDEMLSVMGQEAAPRFNVHSLPLVLPELHNDAAFRSVFAEISKKERLAAIKNDHELTKRRLSEARLYLKNENADQVWHADQQLLAFRKFSPNPISFMGSVYEFFPRFGKLIDVTEHDGVTTCIHSAGSSTRSIQSRYLVASVHAERIGEDITVLYCGKLGSQSGHPIAVQFRPDRIPCNLPHFLGNCGCPVPDDPRSGAQYWSRSMKLDGFRFLLNMNYCMLKHTRWHCPDEYIRTLDKATVVL